MDIVIGFILAACIAAGMIAYFTSYALWIGLGMLVVFFVSVWKEKHMDDPSGDGGIAMAFGIIAPSGILAIVFLLAAGIKALVLWRIGG